MFLGHDVELITREGSLKFLDPWNTAWTKGETRQFMEFLSKSSLHPSAMINNALVLWVFVVLSLRSRRYSRAQGGSLKYRLPKNKAFF